MLAGSGAVRFVFQGPHELCIRYVRPARVLAERLSARHSLGVSVGQITDTKRYSNGAWVRVTVMSEGVPIAVINTHEVREEGSEEHIAVPPTGLAVQATDTGVALSEADDNYVLRYDGIRRAWWDVVTLKDGQPTGLYKQKYARVAAQRWRQHTTIDTDGTGAIGGTSYIAYLGEQLAASFTHVVKHPVTRQVVAVDGGLQVASKPVGRSRQAASVTQDAEIKETTWRAFSTNNNKMVYIHTTMREGATTGGPGQSGFSPRGYTWATTKDGNGNAGGPDGTTNWPGRDCERFLRFYVSESPEYNVAKATGVYVQVDVYSLHRWGNYPHSATTRADRRLDFIGVIPLDLSSDGRKMLVAMYPQAFYMSYGARPVLYAPSINELVFNITTDASGKVTGATVSNSIQTPEWEMSTSHSHNITHHAIAYVLAKTGETTRMCAEEEYVVQQTFEPIELSLASADSLSTITAQFQDILEDYPERMGSHLFTYSSSTQTESTDELLNISAYYDDDDNIVLYRRRLEQSMTISRTGSGSVVMGGTAKRVRTLRSATCEVSEWSWEIDITVTGSLNATTTSTLTGAASVLRGSQSFNNQNYYGQTASSRTISMIEYGENPDTGLPSILANESTSNSENYNFSVDTSVARTDSNFAHSISRSGTTSRRVWRASHSVVTLSAPSQMYDVTWNGAWDAYGWFYYSDSERMSYIHEERNTDIVCNKCVQTVIYSADAAPVLGTEWLSRGAIVTPTESVPAEEAPFFKGRPSLDSFDNIDYTRHKGCAAYNPITRALVSNMRNPVAWTGATESADGLIVPKEPQPSERKSILAVASKLAGETWERDDG